MVVIKQAFFPLWCFARCLPAAFYSVDQILKGEYSENHRAILSYSAVCNKLLCWAELNVFAGEILKCDHSFRK